MIIVCWGCLVKNCITAERLLVEFGVYAPQPRSQKKFSTLVLKIKPPPPSPQMEKP